MTPLQYNVFASKMLGTNLYLKRDDLFPISGGGSKGRKIDYILNKCLEQKCNAVVTCGGIQSNHTRATAIRCKELGLECSIIIHSKPVKTATGNLKILEMLGVNIIYCEMKDVAVVMDNEMERLTYVGFSPFYIWGGGHCYEGTLAFYDAVKEVKNQTDIEFDYVFLASGTGTTQAGLHCGFKHLYKNTTVFGISIARESEKGTLEVKKSISEFIKNKNLDSGYINDIRFTDKYNFGGYENTNSQLADCVDRAAKDSGIILDLTYTGKAWYGMEQFIKENKSGIASKNILFWHTGGLLNLMGSV